MQISDSLRLLLNEGGNIFKDSSGRSLTQNIQQTDIPATVSWLEQLTGLELQDNLLGSTGLRPESGDLDIAIDKQIMPKSKLYAQLNTWAESHGLDPAEYISGTGKDAKPEAAETLSFRAPITGRPDRGYVQVDFMFEPDVEWARFAKRAAAQTAYKDAIKHIVLSAIAKQQGLTWSGQYGLKDRATGQVISKNPLEIAQRLFGRRGSPEDLASVEGAIAAAKQLKVPELMAKIEDELRAKGLDMPQVSEGSPAWYRDVMGRLA